MLTTTHPPHVHQAQRFLACMRCWAAALFLGGLAGLVNAEELPVLTSVSPNAGSTAGGTSVTLTGTNLTGATAVEFDGTAATAYTVNNATTITAITPAHAAGGVIVAVTTPGGFTTLTNGYTYTLPAPIASAYSAGVAANSIAISFYLNLSGGAAASVAVSSAASHGTATASGTSITYTPTAGYSGADSFAYTATNASGTSAPATYVITVSKPTLDLSPNGLSNGTVGAAYSVTLSATKGTAPYSYGITAGSLPAGLSLNASNGVISGTPAASGTSNFTLAATDAYGATGARAYSVKIDATVPTAPTAASATAGNTQASVAFTAPSSNGGASITGYTVTPSPGGITGSGASSPITVTGLTNGQAYTFAVTATNSVGTGAASSASNSVTPKGSQTITFANPGTQNFGTTPTLTATASSGLTPTFMSATTGVCSVTSGGALTFVAPGTCTIHADQTGNGPYLPATQISQSFTVKAVVSHAPTALIATAGDGQASVAFTAPTFSGGAAITGYTVTASPGGVTGTGAASPIVVMGLANGQAYTFTVAATNSVGTGAASAPSNFVTPAGLPITGVCGSANAVAASAAPSASLCSAGVASSVTGAATAFEWDCAGSNGGTTAQCSAPRQYQVTASAAANGSISPAGVQMVAYNATPSFTLTPSALYRIDSVSGCAGTLVGSTYTTGAVAASCTVSASFALISHAITATAQPSAGGSITCTPSTVGEGDSATCAAPANAGYVFQKWTSACAGQAAACSLTNVTAPQESAALFVQKATGLVVPEGVKQGAGLALALQPSAANWVIQSASTATVASTGTSAPSGVQLPYGLVNLKLVTGTAGTSATVVLTYPQALPAGTKYYKFGKTAAKPTIDHWYEFSGAVISGNTITLTLTDGGAGNNDLTANSVIDDPGGPALLAAPPGPGSAQAIPTLDEWGLVLLSLLAGTLGAGMLRRREGQQA